MSRNRRRHPPKARRNREWPPRRLRCAEVKLLEGYVHRAAEDRGMRLLVNPIHIDGRLSAYHWQLHDGTLAHRILDYWPTNGKFWCPRTGEKGWCKDPLQIVEMASKFAATMFQEAT